MVNLDLVVVHLAASMVCRSVSVCYVRNKNGNSRACGRVHVVVVVVVGVVCVCSGMCARACVLRVCRCVRARVRACVRAWCA